MVASDYKNGCNFAIWKQIAGKGISRTQARTLLQKGRTALVKGFRSKAGREFDASLALDQG
jgi:DNA topoisomerase-3